MRKLFVATLAAGLIAQYVYFLISPDFVASHFGRAGIPDGWMSRQANLAVGAVALIVNTAIFMSAGMVFRHVSPKYISFPNKDYWLDPQRKSVSIQLMSRWIEAFGVMTNLSLIAVFHLVYLANQHQPPRLNSRMFLGLLGAYLVVLVLWMIGLYRRFKIPPGESV